MPDKRVLIVDDNADLARLMAEICRVLGHDALVAQDLNSGLEALTAGPRVALTLVDVSLPGGRNGFDFVDQARAIQPDLVYALMSGLGSSAERPAHHEDTTVLQKPIPMDQLKAILGGLKKAP
ncbi:response regulator [Sagittula stellata]|uniref:Sensory box sensor histidine kinase/response regulator n=1 Tax=Sagittula stellata (strain ATCC 700073 / DSM 11524 / E-37) TaxID=388399 RepID=A3K8Q8_SAGS3|nr:response regulator [Sagittula stellata]EBA06496.1 sensory box sensor histidine kinase/response regulator [Sagittula stellata E-37]